MSLDIYLDAVRRTRIHSQNITHNLNTMADHAGIYEALWHPEPGTLAADLIDLLEKAIVDMKQRPDYYKQFDAENGWGTYDDFVPWLEELLEHCRENPDAEVSVWI